MLLFDLFFVVVVVVVVHYIKARDKGRRTEGSAPCDRPLRARDGGSVCVCVYAGR